MFLPLGVTTLLLGKLMLAKETPTHWFGCLSLNMGPPKGQAGNLQKQFRKTNVKKLKHQLKHVMEELH